MTVRFIQMADPQFGMFSAYSKISEDQKSERIESGMILRFIENEIEGLSNETRLFTKAIDVANKLDPDFVVICGDMITLVLVQMDAVKHIEEVILFLNRRLKQ